MKKMCLLVTICFVCTGCATHTIKPETYAKWGWMCQGAIVNYRCEPVVVQIDGVISQSLVIPAAKKQKDEMHPLVPAIVEVQLVAGRSYQVTINRVGSDHAHCRGPIYIDNRRRDAIIEGTVYDFGIYSK